MNDRISNTEYRKKYMDWYGKMIHLYENLLSEEERASLHAWEKENLDGTSIASSDWPGWVEHIGRPPWR